MVSGSDFELTTAAVFGCPVSLSQSLCFRMAFFCFPSKMDDEEFINVRNFALRRQVQDPLDDTRTFSLWRSVFQLYPFVQGTLNSEIDYWEKDYDFAVKLHRDLLSSLSHPLFDQRDLDHYLKLLRYCDANIRDTTLVLKYLSIWWYLTLPWRTFLKTLSNLRIRLLASLLRFLSRTSALPFYRQPPRSRL